MESKYVNEIWLEITFKVNVSQLNINNKKNPDLRAYCDRIIFVEVIEHGRYITSQIVLKLRSNQMHNIQYLVLIASIFCFFF